MSQKSEASLVRNFSQEDFDLFARLSGDDNPIHVDPDFSARTRFGRPVAHGLLLCSVLRGLIEEMLPGSRMTEQSVMFPAPTFAGEPMCFSIVVSDEDDSGTAIKMEVFLVSDATVTCQGHARVLT